MVRFCGQERCLIDANGRVKLGPRLLADFRASGSGVVLHCLPEGALGLYPAPTWARMRQSEPRPAAKAAESLVFRRQLRRFGAMTQAQELTNQGRITIPVLFRAALALEAGAEAVLVGCEIGVELWPALRWEAELALLREHELRRAEAETAAELKRLASAADSLSEERESERAQDA